ncbi:high frequency lysogenization protein HflD [Alcanivorax sediminis]|uniref:High frequency lysogenization protein HflD homolog n=1 Tax=Alcanivorax sediminis TaxID=2663008 RepID=A0A6N7M0V3_9GAMM|nr:high frequency lysogenization protein HflD [Alcanivorax sediminis]MQX53890.1 high frequency lysogenization protein HflD [Alcanivorax sediminis]
MSERFTHEQQQVLALAAVFQAAQLGDDIAVRGDCDPRALRALIEGVMALDADSFDSIYPQPEQLREGLALLELSLNRKSGGASLRPLNYGLALLHLAAKLAKNADTTNILRHRLMALNGQLAHFNDLAEEAFCHRLASIYVDTLGTFRFRIQVKGDPSHLQDEDKAAKIRTLFLTGVRAAFLWQQLGGKRWHLLFKRKQILATLESININ